MYFSPRVSGVQFGVSYIPDTGQEGSNNALNDNQKDAWAVGGNYVGDFGDGLNVAVSLGHYNASQTGMQTIFDGMMENDDGMREAGFLVVKSDAGDDMYTAMPNEDTIKYYNSPSKNDPAKTASAMEAATAQSHLDDYQTTMMKADSKTFSNAALQVGMGSFSFGVVYATNDGGAYKVTPANVALTQAQFDATSLGMQDGIMSSAPAGGGLVVYDTRGKVGFDSNNDGDFVDTDEYTAEDGGNKYSIAVLTAGTIPDGDSRVNSDWMPGEAVPSGHFIVEEGEVYGPVSSGDYALLEGTNIAADDQMTHNDERNDNPMGRMDMIVKDKAKNWDTWGAGVKYSDGPMALSLSHLSTEWDDGGEQDATMLSVSYTLAPGVASKTSLFTAERSMANGRKIDGTGFVTGVVVGF